MLSPLGCVHKRSQGTPNENANEPSCAVWTCWTAIGDASLPGLSGPAVLNGFASGFGLTKSERRTVRAGSTEDQNGRRRDSRFACIWLSEADDAAGDAVIPPEPETAEVADDARDSGGGLAESRSASLRFARRRCCSNAAISASSEFISDGGGGRWSCLMRSSVDWDMGLRSSSMLDEAEASASGSLGRDAYPASGTSVKLVVADGMRAVIAFGHSDERPLRSAQGSRRVVTGAPAADSDLYIKRRI
jgi:hypothetical protein